MTKDLNLDTILYQNGSRLTLGEILQGYHNNANILKTHTEDEGIHTPTEFVDNTSFNKWYVDTTNGNDNNDGSTSGKAWKTIQRAFNQMNHKKYLLTQTIQLADGTYNETPSLVRFDGSFNLLGNSANATAVHITKGIKIDRVKDNCFLDYIKISNASARGVDFSHLGFLRLRYCDISVTGNAVAFWVQNTIFSQVMNCTLNAAASASTYSGVSSIGTFCSIQSSTLNSGGAPQIYSESGIVFLDSPTYSQISGTTYPYRLGQGGQVLPAGLDLIKMWDWYKAQNP